MDVRCALSVVAADSVSLGRSAYVSPDGAVVRFPIDNGRIKVLAPDRIESRALCVL